MQARHRDPEPEYGQDFIDLFNWIFDYNRATRPRINQVLHRLETMLENEIARNV
jgi:hypothetical protein